MKRRRSIKFTLFLCLICICTGIYLAYSIGNARKNARIQSIPGENVSDKKFTTEESIIKELIKKQELIVMEADLSADVTIDASWGDWDVFKKMQIIHFYGKGLYSVDLSNINEDNISIDNENGTISVIIPKPYIKAVYVDETKTLFESTKNGLLRFGDMKLTSEEFEFMISTAKKSMTEKLQGEDTYNKALTNAQEAMTDLMKSIIKSFSGMSTVTVKVQS
ncbi:MAG: DUF4230 domain-containing protein [Bacillota bacterium]|nr:DUF4230 domain-containing protein [Bacillota bacterium]